MESAEICLKAETEDLALAPVGQLRQNAISCFIRRKWRKEGQRGARAEGFAREV